MEAAWTGASLSGGGKTWRTGKATGSLSRWQRTRSLRLKGDGQLLSYNAQRNARPTRQGEEYAALRSTGYLRRKHPIAYLSKQQQSVDVQARGYWTRFQTETIERCPGWQSRRLTVVRGEESVSPAERS